MKSYEHALAVGKPKGKTEKPILKEMHVSKAHSGGYIARHEHHNAPDHHHVLKSMNALKQHMMEHMGGESEPPEDMEPEPGTKPDVAV